MLQRASDGAYWYYISLRELLLKIHYSTRQVGSASVLGSLGGGVSRPSTLAVEMSERVGD
jgi:hypothetical protein